MQYVRIGQPSNSYINQIEGNTSLEKTLTAAYWSWLAQLAMQLAVRTVGYAHQCDVGVYNARTGALDQDRPELTG